MTQKSPSELGKLKIAEELKGLIETKCKSIELELAGDGTAEHPGYKSFHLERRPDNNLGGLLEKAADLRKAQDRVSSIRLDILSLQRTAKEKIKKYNEIVKNVEAEAIAEVEKATVGRRVGRVHKDALVRQKVGEWNQLVVDLNNIYDRTNLTLDYVKEVDSNLRDAAIQLSNQINVVNNMVRIGEIKGAILKPPNY